MFRLIKISRGTHFSKIYSTVSVESDIFCIHNNWRQKLEDEVDLVLCGILLQVFELRNSFEPKRLPVKFATKLEQDIFDFLFLCSPLGEQFELKEIFSGG